VHRGKQEIGIIDIALLPTYRGQGLGGILIRGVLADGAAAEVPVRIHVERFNPAMRLYERLGFRCIGDQGVYLHMEWTPPAGGFAEMNS
jgi:ribosomal protein S18 acetylase RimI-like enzyme